MEGDGFVDFDQARELVGSAMNAVRRLRDGAFWKIAADDLLSLGRELETLSRTVYATHVHLAGELDTRGEAGGRSCSSTATLLRQALLISPAEANGRVNTARQTLTTDTVSGAQVPPQLPTLGAALDAGTVGPEHARTIVATIRKLPTGMPVPDREFWEQFLVDKATELDPRAFETVGKAVQDAADPDGKLDQSDPSSKMEFHLGTRNPRTGLTGITGTLDDHGIDVVRTAIDALAAPKPTSDGTPDPRPAGTRRAHALVGALEGFLTAGGGPSSGGERPHIVVYLHWDQFTGEITRATRESGFSMTTGQARRYLCDATVIPVVLGGDSEILDVGRERRT